MPTMHGGMLASIGDELVQLAPDLLIVTQLRAAPYIKFCPHTALWLDQSDLWSRFITQEISRRRGIPHLTARAQHRTVLRAEADWVRRASALSCAGFADAQAVSKLSGNTVAWLPPPSTRRVIPRRVDGLRTAGFFANFAYWPNRDAFTIVRDHWAPALRRLGWRVIVAGLESDQLNVGDSVELIGPVADIGDYYELIDVTLAPLRLGGGVKVKIIESLMLQRPVVATPYALDGFPPDLAAAIPTASAYEPAFPDLHSLDATIMFGLASDYFAFATWRDKVRGLAGTALAASRT